MCSEFERGPAVTVGHLRIMVCVDDGVSAVSTVRAARELVACSDSVVFLARVLEAAPVPAGARLPSATPEAASGTPAPSPRRRARQELEALGSELGRSAAPVSLIGENAAAAILDFAQAEAIDVIVMGRRSGGPRRRPGLGSTAATVVESAVAPVLLVEATY